MHGFSLNANVNLAPFESITPCGIPDCRLTSMKNILHQPVDPSHLRAEMAKVFGEVFGLTWTHTLSGQEVDGLSDHQNFSPASVS